MMLLEKENDDKALECLEILLKENLMFLAFDINDLIDILEDEFGILFPYSSVENAVRNVKVDIYDIES